MRKPKTDLILAAGLDPVNLAVVKNVLEGAGYMLKACSSWTSAIEFIRYAVPHLIILDLNGDSRAELAYLGKRKSDRMLSLVPALALIGSQRSDALHEALSLGASDCLNKPIDARMLIQKVRRTCRNDESLSRSFQDERRPGVEASIPAKIALASEDGFAVETAAKIATGIRVEIYSPLLDDLACESCLFRRTASPGKCERPGMYLNQVSVVGMKRATIERLRKANEGGI